MQPLRGLDISGRGVSSGSVLKGKLKIGKSWYPGFFGGYLVATSAYARAVSYGTLAGGIPIAPTPKRISAVYSADRGTAMVARTKGDYRVVRDLNS